MNAAPNLTPAAMQRALEAELRAPAYAWHSAHPQPLLPRLDRFLGWLLRPVYAALRWLGKELSALVRWIFHAILGGGEPQAAGGGGKGWEGFIWAVAVLATLALLYVLWRRRHAAAAAPPAPALELQTLDVARAHAADRAAPEWFEQAERLRDGGELRLAFRAAFLGGLAGLGERRRLRLRRDRTNREYWYELRRGAGADGGKRPELFADGARTFEEIWYGQRAADAERFERFLTLQRELAGE